MAKRRNKAAKIREAIAEMGPDATAKEVVVALAARRVRVTPQQVYNVKSTTSPPRKAKPQRDEYATLVQAKQLADALGGIEPARAALAVLAKLL